MSREDQSLRLEDPMITLAHFREGLIVAEAWLNS